MTETLTAFGIALLFALCVSVEMLCIYKMGRVERAVMAQWPKGDRWYLWRVNARQPWMWLALIPLPAFYLFMFIALKGAAQ